MDVENPPTWDGNFEAEQLAWTKQAQLVPDGHWWDTGVGSGDH